MGGAPQAMGISTSCTSVGCDAGHDDCQTSRYAASTFEELIDAPPRRRVVEASKPMSLLEDMSKGFDEHVQNMANLSHMEPLSAAALPKVPRSKTRSTEVPQGHAQLAAMKAVAAVAAADAARCEREERLRNELESRRAEEARRRAEAETERRKRAAIGLQEREAREEVRKAQEQRRTLEQQEADAKVSCFLKSNGFRGIKEARHRRLNRSFPLHVAVQKNDPEMVQLLLLGGADPAQKDSSGKTPQQLAQRFNIGDSHGKVLAMLGAL